MTDRVVAQADKTISLFVGALLLSQIASIGALTQCANADEQIGTNSALVDLIEGKQFGLAEKRIAKDNVNRPQVDGTTPLHWAAYHDRLGLCSKLIKAGADAQARNRYGVRALSIACENGNGDLVKLLLENGADPNCELLGGESALMTAARTGDVESVRWLIKFKARVNHKEYRDQTALMWAAAEGHADVCTLLLKAGADWKPQLKSGFSAIFFAARNGHQEVVDVFLESGADLNATMNPLKAGGKHPRKGTSLLALAVENGHFTLALSLLNQGADPNDQRSGYTPLHMISWVRKPNRGDGPDGDPAPTIKGKTTSLEFARQLIGAGADVNARLKRGQARRGRLNHKGMTPLMFAAKTADIPLMKLLLKHGADPQLKNVDDTTTLMVAAGLGTIAPREEAGSEEEALAAVKLLLQLGGNVNAVNKNGETCLHGAAYKSFPRVFELLHERGAKLDVWYRKNKYGWTPLLIAEGHRPGNFKPSFETIKAVHTALIDHGIKPPPPTPRKKRKGY